MIKISYREVFAISPVLYHFTTIYKAANILKDDEFKLSSALGKKAEEEHVEGRKWYYLSTTRHRLGGYHKDTDNAGWLLMNLDGVGLAHNYSGKPIDYWGENFRKVDPTKMEAEDRIYSTKPVIPNASKYIESIHIMGPRRIYDTKKKDFMGGSQLYQDKTEGSIEDFMEEISPLVKLANARGVKIFVYTDPKEWLSQDKSKAIDISRAVFSTNKEVLPSGYSRGNKPFPFMEMLEDLYNAHSKDMLTNPKAKTLADSNYFLNYTGKPSDSFHYEIQSDIMPDFVNYDGGKNVSADKIVEMMKRTDSKNIPDLFAKLAAKWRKIYEQESSKRLVAKRHD